ncbi:MAG: hypothetical protein ACK5FT_05445 [Sphingomonadales bacterium]|jgi:hypothetical protein
MKKVPDTPIINEALNIVKAALSDNIFNHSMRTYLYANEFGLLQVGAHLDVMGTKVKSIEKDKRYQILKEYPKNYFFFEFNSCLIKSFSNFDSVRGLVNPEHCCGKNHYLNLNL